MAAEQPERERTDEEEPAEEIPWRVPEPERPADPGVPPREDPEPVGPGA